VLAIAIVDSDNSPRREEVADDESYDFGQGGSFYLNAAKAPWDCNYQMHDYLVLELPQLERKTITKSISVFMKPMTIANI
jgi:S-formylglutathione hydrolase